MSGGLIELVAKGPQDVYLTGSPQVSFFRQQYKRHTNFSMRTEQLDYTGKFTGGSMVTVPIISKGDLMTYLWIEAPDICVGGTDSDQAIHSSNDTSVTEFSLFIGGQEIVKLDGLFIQNVHNLLYNASSARAGMASTVNVTPTNATASAANKSDHYVIPFFFSEEWTKCLPLVALQYHQVELRINMRNSIARTDQPKIFANYVYLDTDERKFFAETSHEILIHQVQHQLASNTDTEFDLSYFNHPVKAVHLVNGSNDDNWVNAYTFDKATLYLNGSPIFENMSNVYHHTVVPQMHCSVVPPGDAIERAPVYTWPFCLTLNKYQPTGTANFSRFDSSSLKITSPTVGGGDTGSGLHRIYAVNYNILRVKGGMAGLAFSN